MQKLEALTTSRTREIANIVENNGFGDRELLEFIKQHPHAAGILFMHSLLLKKGDEFSFPTTPTKEEENESAEKADLGFRARVGRHSIAVGLTFNLLLTLLSETRQIPINDYVLNIGTEVMCLHDAKKLEEIRGRQVYGSSDEAYNHAERYLASILNNAGYPPQFVRLAGNIGHNGAKEYLTAPEMWTIIDQCAYLADELLQETVIQKDILGKVHRLQTDPKYDEANRTGFPDRQGHPTFTNPDGSLKRKYDIQEEATKQMAQNVSSLLGIEWQDLGKYLILEAKARGYYQALID